MALSLWRNLVFSYRTPILIVALLSMDQGCKTLAFSGITLQVMQEDVPRMISGPGTWYWKAEALVLLTIAVRGDPA